MNQTSTNYELAAPTIDQYRALERQLHTVTQQRDVAQAEINELKQSLKTAAQAAVACEKQRQVLEDELRELKHSPRAAAKTVSLGMEQGIKQDEDMRKLIACCAFAKQMKAKVTIALNKSMLTIDSTGE